MPRLALLTVSFLVLASCSEPNSQYCLNGAHADDPMCKSGGPCMNNSDCTAMPSFPVCDTMDNNRTCVLCTADDHALCTGMTPRCESHACVACVDDSDCGDPGVGVCLPNGSCADQSSIIHAISTDGSTMPTCGGMGVGNACTLDTALTLPRTATRNVIKLDDAGPYANMNGFTVDTDASIELTIDARGATLHRTMDGAIFTVNSANQNYKAVTLLGGTIEGATNSDGISCGTNATLILDGTTIAMNEKSAINANGGCQLTVTNAMIHNNSLRSGQFVAGIVENGDSLTLARSWLLSNRGGGVAINSGTFVVVGNAFLNNGSVMSPTGGVVIGASADASNRLDFNTIAHNSIQPGSRTAGVDCNAGTSTLGHNNIIWDNDPFIVPPAPPPPQVSGSCKYSYSFVGPGVLMLGSNDGGHNMSVDPKLKDETNDPHLNVGSPAHQYADPTADLTGIASKDIDGQLRVAPADIGADQMQ